MTNAELQERLAILRASGVASAHIEDGVTKLIVSFEPPAFEQPEAQSAGGWKTAPTPLDPPSRLDQQQDWGSTPRAVE